MKTKIPASEKLTIGLDLGDRRHHACVLDEAGEILAEEAVVNGSPKGSWVDFYGSPKGSWVDF